MPNIDNSVQSGLNVKTRIFFVLFILILAVGRTWGLLDDFLAGRFLLFSLLGIWALFFVIKIKEYNFTYIDLAFILYYIISAVSLSWSVLPSAGFYTVQAIGLAYLFYVLFRLLSPLIPADFFQKIISLGSLLVMGVVLVQLVQVGIKSGISNNNIYEITGWAGHKNLTASILFLLFGFTVYYSVLGKRTIWIWMILLLQLAFILVLQSRAVILAWCLFLMGVLWYILIDKKIIWASIRYKLLYSLAGAVILAFILFFSFGGTTTDIKKLSPTTYLESASGAERRFVWYKTRQLIKENWIKGYGAGNWKLVFPSKSIEGSYRLQTQNVIFTRAHNDFLEIWTETGIIGLICYLSLFLIALWNLIYKFKSGNAQNKSSALVLLFLLLGYLVIAFFDFPRERMEHTLLLSLLFALSINYRDESTRLKFSIPLKGRGYPIFIYSLFFVLMVNCMYSYYVIKGENHTRKAMEAKVSGQWQTVGQESKKAYSPFYQINPIASSVKWLEGNAAYNQGKYVEAEKLLALASQHTPYHFVCLNDYASTIVQLRKYPEAIEIYKKVLFINPRFEDAKFNISYAYAQVRNFDKALEWLEKTTTLPDKKQAFIKAIEELKAKN